MLPIFASPSSTGICGSCPVCQSAPCSGLLLRQAGQRVAVQTSVVVRDEQVLRCPATQLVGDLAPVHLADLTVQISAAAVPGGRSGTGGFYAAVCTPTPSGSSSALALSHPAPATTGSPRLESPSAVLLPVIHTQHLRLPCILSFICFIFSHYEVLHIVFSLHIRKTHFSQEDAPSFGHKLTSQL